MISGTTLLICGFLVTHAHECDSRYIILIFILRCLHQSLTYPEDYNMIFNVSVAMCIYYILCYILVVVFTQEILIGNNKLCGLPLNVVGSNPSSQ